MAPALGRLASPAQNILRSQKTYRGADNVRNRKKRSTAGDTPANRTQQSRFALPAKDSEGGVHPEEVSGFVVLAPTLRGVFVRRSGEYIITFAALTPTGVTPGLRFRVGYSQ